MAYGDFVIQQNLNFNIHKGDVFIVMGGNGCGKSTLLRHLLGLKMPAAGEIFYQEQNLWEISPQQRKKIMRANGVMYQSGALWSSLTLAENIELPLKEYTTLEADEIKGLAYLKLALVGLVGFEEYYPAEISGGMKKRAGLARALALDPDILFFDEPSAGLDPISAKLLDDLILSIQESLGTTIVVVTHDLPSLFAIGTDAVFLDS
ncbi:MAG: ATP-binding cassette domain-containing protein, partial [Methyloprofundus sp.]|nr:ATP-binding cassette domain-containing protein [Methyloprofundus sp.]